MRETCLVNPVTRQVETVKVELIARMLLLPATAMIDFSLGIRKHLFELQPDS